MVQDKAAVKSILRDGVNCFALSFLFNIRVSGEAWHPLFIFYFRHIICEIRQLALCDKKNVMICIFLVFITLDSK